ncbi:hypothetical protein EOA88_09575 [Mesorhizobium sp. M5C.F.Ca.IN.020.14.1.1]|nr:hypothetical protein EOA88_09575 [Mesorhizobium sp. M5C.F.Ca.IN.020.14.1.1]
MDAVAGGERVPCSEEEVRKFFDRMTSAQKRDAYQLAKSCSATCQADADELISEALVRMSDGRRKRTAHETDLFPVFMGTIKSLATDRHFISECARIRRMGKGKYGVVDASAMADKLGADDAIVEEALDPEDYRKAILAEIAGDDELGQLFEAICAGFKGKELAELLEMDTNALATARRRFKRNVHEAAKKMKLSGVARER